MITESDIDFTKLSPEDFEELCYDLIKSRGFTNVNWKKGTGDKGRDIESNLFINHSLVPNLSTKWFFECKKYNRGVTINDLSNKLTWLLTEKVDYFVIITSSYLTNQTKEYIKKFNETYQKKVLYLEKPQIVEQIIKDDKLISKYFFNEDKNIIQNVIGNWNNYNIYPDPSLLAILYEKIDPNKLDTFELGFLWNSYVKQNDLLYLWFEENYYFDYSHLLEFLIARIKNKKDFAINKISFVNFDSFSYTEISDINTQLIDNLTFIYEGKKMWGNYSLNEDKNQKILEILLIGKPKTSIFLCYSDLKRKETLTSLSNKVINFISQKPEYSSIFQKLK